MKYEQLWKDIETLNIVLWHQLKQVDKRKQVVFIILQRLLYALAYSL